MIKITNQDKSKQKLSFTTDMHIGLANAIRRSVLEIPTMAIDEVSIIKNDSALYDEMVAHRIGLIPIKTDKGLKETKFKVVEVGPKVVYSSDFKPSVGTDYKIPIVILDKEQELEVECDARIGKGIDHVKYSPGLVYYKHNIDPDVLDYVIVSEDGKISYDEDELKSKNVSDAIMNKIKKSVNANELIFEIESWGQIDTKEIYLRAIEALDENLKELDKAIGK